MAFENAWIGKRESALEELLTLPLRKENPYIMEWKQNGGKVFGYTCSYVPEEVLYAHEGPGGILPIRMGAMNCETTEDADIYMHKFMCSFVRSLVQLGISGEYDFLDGFVVTSCCEHMRRIYEQWRDHVKTPLVTMISVPHDTRGEHRLKWYSDEIRNLISDIDMKYGYHSTEAGLGKAIAVYNRYRSLMTELYDLRMGQYPLISGSEAMKIAQAGFCMPKAVFNEKLAEAIGEIKKRPGIRDYSARIMIGGSYVDDASLIDIIESTGAVVVTDNLCTGRKYIEGLVDADAGSDPMEQIAKRYFNKISCPRMINGYTDRVNFTRKLIREAKVDGVIFQRISFCDNHAVENLMEGKLLEEEGISVLHLEREYLAADKGRFKTRIQAFMEKIAN